MIFENFYNQFMQVKILCCCYDKTMNPWYIYFSRNSLMILSEVAPCFNHICSLYRSRNLGCSSRSVFIYSIIPAVFKDLNSSRVIRPSSISLISRTLTLRTEYFVRRLERRNLLSVVACRGAPHVITKIEPRKSNSCN